MKFEELPDGCRHNDDSAENSGHDPGPIGIVDHPQINDRDCGASEKRGDLHSVETTLVPCGFFVMPLSLGLKSALYVFECFIHEGFVGLMLDYAQENLQSSTKKAPTFSGLNIIHR